MSRAAFAAVAGTALALLAVAAGCDAPSARGQRAEPGWIVTQVPAGSAEASWAPRAGAVGLDERYPAGSRIVFVAAAGPRVLSGDLVAAGGPAVTFDGAAVLFAGKAAATARWAIYRSSLSSPRPRPVLEHDGDCGDPRPLPGGRLVAVCTSPGERPIPSLYVAGPDPSDAERITFGPGPAFDPEPLQDGRILFSMEQAPGPGRPPGALALFTLNPDGTMLAPFAGSHRPPAIKRRARQTRDGGVVYLASDRPGGAGVERVEMRLPHAAPTEAWAGARAVRVSAVEPLPDGDYLVAGQGLGEEAVAGSTSAIWRVGRDGRARPVHDGAAWDDVEAIPSRPAEPPRGRPSGRWPDRDAATLICYDATRVDGEHGPAPGEAASTATVAVEALGPERGDVPPAVVVLGEVPVHDDGSFWAEVPADVPIRVRALDASGADLARSDWFWMRPGEVRACFGCHEDRAAAPVNRRVRALAEPPVELHAATRERSR